jgi:YnbE-like lipoprotein
MNTTKIILIVAISWMSWACSPTVALQAPDKPLEINLNVKIDHQISVKVDKQLDDVMSKNKDIF